MAENKDKKVLNVPNKRELTPNEFDSVEHKEVKLKRNVPNLRFKEFEGEWKENKLRNICTFYSGGTPTSSNKNYYDGNIPFIRSGELHQEKTELMITEEGYNNSSTKMVEKGDLLLAMYGATSGDIAISRIEGAINQAILCIKTNHNKKFLETIWSKHLNRILRTYLQGGQGNLSADVIKQITFSIPTIQEQKELAQLFFILDERIATQNKIIDKLESLIKGLNDTLYAQYGSVQSTSFAELGHSYSGLSGKSAEDFGKGKPFITYLNVYSNNIINEKEYQYVSIEEGEKQNKVKYGDVLFTLSSETPNEVGIGAVYLGEDEVYLNSFCFGIHIENKKLTYSPYLSFYISSTPFRKFIYPFAQGSTRFNLCKADFEKAKIQLPTLENQKRIYSILNSLTLKTETEKNVLKQYELQKQYLLRHMFI